MGQGEQNGSRVSVEGGGEGNNTEIGLFILFPYKQPRARPSLGESFFRGPPMTSTTHGGTSSGDTKDNNGPLAWQHAGHQPRPLLLILGEWGSAKRASEPANNQLCSTVLAHLAVELAWATSKCGGHPTLTWQWAGRLVCPHTPLHPALSHTGWSQLLSNPGLGPLQTMGPGTLYWLRPILMALFPSSNKYEAYKIKCVASCP